MFKNIFGIDVTNVHFNSQLIIQGGLFVPIKGEKQDGHKYVIDAIKNGAVATLWDKNTPIPLGLEKDIKVIVVEDTVKAFQELAYEYRKEINPIVIGVTGSNGKTTTKEMLDIVLSEKFKVHKNSGNYNNHLGVPLTLLSMPINTDICIVEMGMNHSGEISLLTNIANPDYAIITNIGESHIGLLGSRENIAAAKLEIIEGLSNKSNIIFDGDEPLLNHIKGFPITNKDIQDIKQVENKLVFNYIDKTFEISTFGLHNAKNAALAIKVGILLNVDPNIIHNGLMKFRNQSMRLEYKENENNSYLLDCYNASLTSMKSALLTFESIDTKKNKIAILGDIFELGDESIDTHKNIGELIYLEQDIQYWLVGPEMRAAYEVVIGNDNTQYFSSKSNLLDYIELNKSTFNHHYFLIKASRGMKMEEVYEQLNHY
ncbi:UDP-N-acetylmuramoyl-tripeptide--D-alanyl-D-alanine ligase [[Brevibacterium] frigoritolerans]|nr:UDP-N-acetylmuramoyl-tripeptide--D-alanyl-D-alanine ligase [Peribacillus frigoritolerans]